MANQDLVSLSVSMIAGDSNWWPFWVIVKLRDYVQYNYFCYDNFIDNTTLPLWKFSRQTVGIAGDDIMFTIQFALNVACPPVCHHRHYVSQAYSPQTHPFLENPMYTWGSPWVSGHWPWSHGPHNDLGWWLGCLLSLWGPETGLSLADLRCRLCLSQPFLVWCLVSPSGSSNSNKHSNTIKL